VLFNERKQKVGIDLYDGEIRCVDDGIGELVDRLRRNGQWENTLFVLTSDHGEEFFEHGLLGHGFSLFQAVVGVPLILRGPGVPAGKVVEEPVQVLDMPATLLDLAQAGTTELGDGVSFAPLVRDEPWERARTYFIESEFGQNEHDTRSFVFTGVREGRWKLVLTEANAWFPPENPKYGGEALYDLESDPEEKHNLFHAPEHKELVQRLLAELTEHSRFLQETGFRDVVPAALDPAMQEELRALGYL
jgi:arylsulfatase A-like enzyme